MTRHHVDFITFHRPQQDRFRRAGDDPLSQLLGHPLDLIRSHAQRLGELGVR